MKNLLLIFLAIIVAGCINPEEQRIKDYLNGKLINPADKITDVEIIGEDSVLSFVPMQSMITDCELGIGDTDSIYGQLGAYFYHASLARSLCLSDDKKHKSLTSLHPGHWLRICKIRAKTNNKSADNIEVIFDTDKITPIKLGREYDEDLRMWDLRIQSLPQNKMRYY